MIVTTRKVAGLATFVCALAPFVGHAGGAPIGAPMLHDGRYYEVVISEAISWEAARAAAEARTHAGIQGQLATIGSAAEDAFVHQLRQSFVSDGAELWVGGHQVPCATTDPEPGCGWIWINGEPIAAINASSPYTNWLPGEPNNLQRAPDSKHRATEEHLAIGLGGAFGWNDEGSLANIRGYVVEYGDKVVISAAECAADGPGCNPTGAQVLRYPPTAKLAEGATLTARTFRFSDDPARCGNAPLTLFGGAVVIPPYLCGHPDFLVIETEAAGVELPSGAILVENLTEEALPDNLYGCGPRRQNPAGVLDPDPSHRDVAAWQSQNPAHMLETVLGAGRFFGSVTEVTYACGSSRGKVVAGSYHFIGLRIHPGPGNEFVDGNVQGNHQSFIELTSYKLELLLASVSAAQETLPGASYVALRAHVDGAIRSHARGQYKSALASIRKFLKEVAQAKYRTVGGANPSGEHEMRASNIEFMYTNKLIPYAYRP